MGRPSWSCVGVALGLGASRAGPRPTPAQRADAIDALVRCPSCEGISVADSSASTAAAIRRAVAAASRAGQSDAQIDAFLVSRYGPGILLRPPVHGWTAWVWVLPPAAVASRRPVWRCSVLRRRRVATPWRCRPRTAPWWSRRCRIAPFEPAADLSGARPVTNAELDDERSFLLDSLEDLERERAAGDLSEADYAVLRDRYTRRAAEVLRALAYRRSPTASARTDATATRGRPATKSVGGRARRQRTRQRVGAGDAGGWSWGGRWLSCGGGGASRWS